MNLSITGPIGSLVIGEDVPMIVTAKDHVIDGARYVDASLFCHVASIPRVMNLSITGPIGSIRTVGIKTRESQRLSPRRRRGRKEK
jgi:hypothetical protein